MTRIAFSTYFMTKYNPKKQTIPIDVSRNDFILLFSATKHLHFLRFLYTRKWNAISKNNVVAVVLAQPAGHQGGGHGADVDGHVEQLEAGVPPDVVVVVQAADDRRQVRLDEAGVDGDQEIRRPRRISIRSKIKRHRQSLPRTIH